MILESRELADEYGCCPHSMDSLNPWCDYCCRADAPWIRPSDADSWCLARPWAGEGGANTELHQCDSHEAHRRLQRQAADELTRMRYEEGL